MGISFNRLGFGFSIASFIGFVVFSVYLLFTSDESFRAIVGLICAASVLAPRIIYKKTRLFNFLSAELLGVLELMLDLLLIFNGIGALGFYLEMQYYDMALHLFSPLAVGIMLALMLESYLHRYTIQSIRIIQWFTITGTITLVLFWEFWESVGDMIFHTQMSGQPGEPFDTLYDVLGGIAIMAVLYLFNRYLLAPSIRILAVSKIQK
ncbi:MAG: hypothetical protein ABIG66_05035 [Candidatus Kerfeldbacteria bacterium]